MQAKSELRSWDYWRWVLLMLAVYFALWLSALPRLYGWHADDWCCYVKGIETTQDARMAFTCRTNALQPYFFLYSYLPIASGWQLPSYPLPIYEERAGNFRFLLLYTIIFHAVVATSWAWLARRICDNHAAALLSLAMLLCSTEFVLWTPQSETRFVGFPLVVVGIDLLLREPRTGRRFLAGSLFGFSQSLHYTSLYLIVPASLVFCMREVRAGWHKAWFWKGWVAFALGCVWLQGSLELISYFYFKIPWQHGPCMSLVGLMSNHESPLSMAGNLSLWWEYAHSLLGLPLLLAAVVGAVLFLRLGTSDPATLSRRWAIVATVLVGLAMLIFSTSMPFFRKTALLQPLVFLFAACAVVEVPRMLVRDRSAIAPKKRGITMARALLATSFLAAIELQPMRHSAEVFREHQGLGKVIAWAHQHKDPGSLRWLIARRPYLYTLDQLRHDDPEAWLITYFPQETVMNWPSWMYYLSQATPLYSRPTLWATYGAHVVHHLKSETDLLRDPVMNEARVYRVGDLQKILRADKELVVDKVAADSTQTPLVEAVNVLDQDASPDGNHAWASADAPLPHFLELTFHEPYELAAVGIVLPLWHAPRAEEIDVEGAAEGVPCHRLWSGSDLAHTPVVAAGWPPERLKRLRVVIRRQITPFSVDNVTRVEELVFPGYRIVAPKPFRPLPPLELADVQCEGDELVAHGKSITASTRLLLDGRPLCTSFRTVPLRFPKTLNCIAQLPDGEIRSVLAGTFPPGDRAAQVYLSDGIRRSNVLSIRRPDQAIVNYGDGLEAVIP
jgi:hypothetical protein